MTACLDLWEEELWGYGCFSLEPMGKLLLTTGGKAGFPVSTYKLTSAGTVCV